MLLCHQIKLDRWTITVTNPPHPQFLINIIGLQCHNNINFTIQLPPSLAHTLTTPSLVVMDANLINAQEYA